MTIPGIRPSRSLVIAVILFATVAPQATSQDMRDLDDVLFDDAVERLLVAPSLASDEVPVAGDQDPGWLEGEHLLGDWGGLRPALEEVGISYELIYTFDLAQPLAGGRRKRATPLGWLDFSLNVDLETIIGLDGATLFAGLMAQHGRSPSIDTLDFQAFSNIDVDDTVVLYELWYEQVIAEGLLRFKLGKVDFNSEFAFLDAAGTALNASASFSPTIFLGPSTPDSAMSFNAFLMPTDWLQIGVGLYDSDHDDVIPGTRTLHAEFHEVFVVGEIALNWELPLGPGRAGIGFWFHSGDFEAWDGGEEDGIGGLQLVLEQTLWQEFPEDPSRSEGLVLTLQYGHADADVAEVDHHFALGLFWQGLFDGRNDDVTGLYLSHVDLVEDAGFARNETAIEVFHRFQLTPFLSVQPDLQWIIDAGGSEENVLVASLRVELIF